ncbi:MAG: hypothetical protein HC886_12485 [Leptolyngbyaceae cyanobacterium SM1_1_3]|nr:hypothetical protein [Leptolyngbyaceae cyanobacterium SM1_1_3]
MSNWQMLLGLVAGGIYVLGFIPYLVAIYQGKTRPNRATWWIWVAVGLILVLAIAPWELPTKSGCRLRQQFVL